jgi:hypothetical protein
MSICSTERPLHAYPGPDPLKKFCNKFTHSF